MNWTKYLIFILCVNYIAAQIDGINAGSSDDSASLDTDTDIDTDTETDNETDAETDTETDTESDNDTEINDNNTFSTSSVSNSNGGSNNNPFFTTSSTTTSTELALPLIGQNDSNIIDGLPLNQPFTGRDIPNIHNSHHYKVKLKLFFFSLNLK